MCGQLLSSLRKGRGGEEGRAGGRGGRRGERRHGTTKQTNLAMSFCHYTQHTLHRREIFSPTSKKCSTRSLPGHH